MYGVVKWFNEEKGFGFITSDDGQDVFVHYSNIIADGYKKLEEGKRVCFNLQESERGLSAINVEEMGE